MLFNTAPRLMQLCAAMEFEWTETETFGKISMTPVLNKVESHIHELAHAASFGIHPFNHDHPLAMMVMDSFHEVATHTSLGESDHIEAEGLAIELLVIRASRIPIGLRRQHKIVRFAVDGMKEKWWTDKILLRLVYYLMEQSDTKAKAATVMTWLERAHKSWLVKLRQKELTLQRIGARAARTT